MVHLDPKESKIHGFLAVRFAIRDLL
jgi:hypothetical protein